MKFTNSNTSKTAGMPIRYALLVLVMLFSFLQDLKSQTTFLGDLQSAKFPAYIEQFKSDGTKAYFIGWTNQEATKHVFVTDGTEAGTKNLSQAFEVNGIFNVQNIELVGNTLFFSTNSTIYKSDGTVSGTEMVADGFAYSISNLKAANGLLFFSADDQVNGIELWKSDGTEAGTQMVKDIKLEFSLSGNDASPTNLMSIGNKLIFAASSIEYGLELWVSDGTEAGTTLLKDINPGTSGLFRVGANTDIAILNNELYFKLQLSSGKDQLWKTDGTPSGTVLISDFVGVSTTLSGFLTFNNEVYFGVVQGSNFKLYKTDGTSGGTIEVSANGPSHNAQLIANGGEFYYVRNTILYKSDGTDGGTSAIKTFNSSTLLPIEVLNGKFIFASDARDFGGLGYELWESDGTDGGTQLIVDLFSGAKSGIMTTGNNSGVTTLKLGNEILFYGNDGSSGETLWKTDGTAGGTLKVADINPLGLAAPFTTFVNMVNVGAEVLFDLQNQTGEIWKTNGTFGGTTKVGNTEDFEINRGSTLFSGVNNAAAISGNTLWYIDNNFSSIAKVPITDGAVSGIGDGAFAGDKFIFSSGLDFFANGQEAWVSDGTDVGTQILVDIIPGGGNPNSSNPNGFTSVNNLVFFSAADASGIGALWVTDGTVGGTTKLSAEGPRSKGVALGNEYFYGTWNGSTITLNKSDGTAGGTSVVKSFAGNQFLTNFQSADDAIFFTIPSGADKGLWISDGTEAGTVKVSTTLTEFSDPNKLGNKYYFINSSKLYETDGSLAGTKIILGSGGSVLELVASGSKLFYTFKSQISSQITTFYLFDGDISTVVEVPGTTSLSDFQDLHVNGNKVYFRASTLENGTELHVYEAPPTPTVAVSIRYVHNSAGQVITGIPDGYQVGEGGATTSVGETTLDKQVTSFFDFVISNSGGAELTFTSAPTFTGTHAASFEFIDFPSSIAAQSTGKFKVKYTGNDVEGTQIVAVNLFTNDPDNNTYTFEISAKNVTKPSFQGFNQDFGLLPAKDRGELGFGSLAIGETVTKTIYIANSGRGNPLNINQVFFEGDAAGDYSVKEIRNETGIKAYLYHTIQPINALDSVKLRESFRATIVIEYAPTASGSREAIMRLDTNSPNDDFENGKFHLSLLGSGSCVDVGSITPEGPVTICQDSGESVTLSIPAIDGAEYCWGDTGWKRVKNFGGTNPSEHYLTFDNANTPIVGMRSSTGMANVYKFENDDFVQVGPADFGDIKYNNQENKAEKGFDIATNPVNGDVYFAYSDNSNSGKITVKMFDGSAWQTVGSNGFSDGVARIVNLKISPTGELYVAFRDAANFNRATVMTFDGTNWVPLEKKGFTAASALSIDLELVGEIPHLAYRDGGRPNSGATVAKFENDAWSVIGTAGFSEGSLQYIDLEVDSNNKLYVAYVDDENGEKLTIKTYDGADWVNVGSFSRLPNQISGLDLELNGTVPYLSYVKGPTAGFFEYSDGAWLEKELLFEGYSIMSLATDNNGVLYNTSNSFLVSGVGETSFSLQKLEVGNCLSTTNTLVTSDPGFYQVTVTIPGSGCVARSQNIVEVRVVECLPEMVVQGNNLEIENGDQSPRYLDGTQFINVQANASGTSTFNIINTGLADLDLTLPLTLTGANADKFSISSQPQSATVAKEDTVSFEVQFNAPADYNTYEAIVNIANNVAGESPYTFKVKGTATGISFSMADSFTLDNNSDGKAGPSDVIKYTVTVDNAAGAPTYTNPVFGYSQIIPNTTLVVGSVTTSVGSVATGNTAGETLPATFLGDLAAGGNVIITFELEVSPNLGEDVKEIIAQAQLFIGNQLTNLSDDPSIGGGQDPTVTAVAPRGLSMVSATKDSDTQITVTFSDNVEMPNGSTPFANFIITDGLGTVFSATSIADGTAGDDQLIITVANTSAAVGDLILTYDTSKDEGQVSVFADITKILTDNFVGVVIDSDSVIPTLVSAERNSNTEITLTFSEPVQTNATNPTDFTVTDGVGANFAVTAQADGTAKDALIVLTVSDLSGAVGDLIVTYANNNNEISDFGNNDLATDATGVSISDTWSFITTWTTTSDGESIVIPTSTLSTISIMWGDGEFDTGVNGNKSHTYSDAGTYTVKISPTLTRIFMGSTDATNNAANKEKLTSVEQWGTSVWTNMTGAFTGATNVVVNASDAPDLSSATSMNNMFSYASSFNQSIDHWDVSNVTDMTGLFTAAVAFNQSLNNWDVSNVTNMSGMFSSASTFNGDISSWNVGKVTNMSSMFGLSTVFNQDISTWDVSKVTNMSTMFAYTDEFNQDISAWDVGAVEYMTNMFLNTKIFNQDISSWDVGSVLDMKSMFSSALAFNQPLNDWDVSKVTNMSSMFTSSPFNQDLNNWVTSNVTNMSSMFSDARAFNGNISSWDVSAVTNMSNMFAVARAFNQDISGWNVSKVTSMQQMFNVALAFNQNIGLWDVSSVTNMVEMMRSTGAFDYDLGDWDLTSITSISGMLNGTGMSVKNYDETLIGWAAQDLTDGLSFGASGKNYCAGATARQSLIDNQGWTISDAGELCLPTMVSAVIDNNTQITVTFDSNVRTNGTNPTDFTVTDAAGETYAVSAQVDGTAGDTDIVLTVADLTAVTGKVTVTYTNNNNEISDTSTGSLITATDATGVNIERAFITTWETTTPNESIVIPTASGETYSYSINWGDGSSDDNQTGNASHNYATAGSYTVSITGTFPRIHLGSSIPFAQENKDKLLRVEQWGSIDWKSMEEAFNGASNMTIQATDAPDLAEVTSMQGMFSSATSLNQDINHWDVSNITNMESVFNRASAFNQDLSNWNTSSVTNMRSMFSSATNFNGDISTWDVSKVESMRAMFAYATAFNQSLNNWTTSSLTNMGSMFEGARTFNGAMGNWDMSKVTDMNAIFVTAGNFNQDISGWNTSALTNAAYMFEGAAAFNQDISGWDMSKVSSMNGMFKSATAFDQNLAAWDIGNVADMGGMFDNSGMSRNNYDNTLIGWGAQTVQNGVTLGAAGVNYCSGATAREGLINNAAWTITDAGEKCLPSVQSVNIDDGLYGIDVELVFTLIFDQAVVVTGTPQLAFTVGSTLVNATYSSASSSATELRFSYKVLAGQEDTDGIQLGTIINLNGGSIKDTDDQNAELDLNGVTSTTGVLVDGIVPTITIVSISDDTGSSDSDLITNDNSLFVRGTSEPNSRITLSVDGTEIAGSPTADGNGDWEFSPIGEGLFTVEEGLRTFTAVAEDLAGNQSGISADFVVTVDLTAPNAPTIDLAASTDLGTSNSDNLTSGSTITLQGTAEANSFILLTLVDESGNPVDIQGNPVDIAQFISEYYELAPIKADDSGNWTYSGPAFPTGTYPVAVIAIDLAGNFSETSETLVLEFDQDLFLSTTSPIDEEVDVLPNANLVATFDKNVVKGTGNITIRKSSDDTVIETIDVTGNNVTVSGAEVTIDPVDNILPPDTEFYINIEESAFENEAGAPFAGVSDNSTWNFRIIAASVVSSVEVPADATYKVGAELEFTVNMVLPITVTGTLTLPITIGSAEVNATLTGATSNTSALVFSYTVVEGDLDTDGIAIGTAMNLNGGTMKDEFEVDALLALNNISSTTNVLVDGIIPIAPVITGLSEDSGSSDSDQLTNDQTLTFTGTAEANSSVTVFVDGNNRGTATADGSGDWSFDSSVGEAALVLAEGDHTVTATTTDAAGNTSVQSADFDLEVDITAPVAPTIDLAASTDLGTSNSDNLTSGSTITLQGTAEANSFILLTLVDESGNPVDESGNPIDIAQFISAYYELAPIKADDSGNWTYSGPAFPTGTYPVAVIAIDLAGNFSETSETLVLVYDQDLSLSTTSPIDEEVDVLPNANLIATFDKNVTKGTGNITIRKSSDDSVIETIDVTGNNVTVSGAEVTINPVDNILPPDTEFYINIEEGAFENEAGAPFAGISDNSTWNFRIIAASVVTSVEVPSDATYKVGDELEFTVNMVLPITVTGTPTITITIGSSVVNATLKGTASNTSELIFSYTIVEGDLDTDGITIGTAMNLNGGTMKDEFEVDALLALNNISSTLNVLVDGIIPIAPVITGLSEDSGSSDSDQLTNDQTLTFTGTAEANSSVTVFVDGNNRGTATADGLGDWSFDSSVGEAALVLAEGDHTVTATATDAAGNTSVQSADFDLEVDITAPVAPTIDLAASTDLGMSNSDNLTSGSTITLQGTAEAGAIVVVAAQGSGPADPVVADASGNWSLTIDEQIPSGTYQLLAVATDAAGNESEISSVLALVIDQDLNISDTSPFEGETDVLPNANLVATFDKNVVKGTGNITIRKSSDDTMIETIDVAGNNVTVSGAEVTIDPVGNILPPDTEFYVTIDEGAFENEAGADFRGLTNPTIWTFRIIAASVVSSVEVPSNKTYGIGDNLDFTVNMILPISISGTATIPVTIGSSTVNATQVGTVNNTSTILFRYTLLEDQLDVDGIAVGSSMNLNGGVMRDVFNVDAILTLNNVGVTTAVLVDGVKPIPTLSSSAVNLVKGAFSTTITYDESVENVSVNDLVVTNGTASNLQSITTGKVWTVDITPSNDGTVTVALPAATATDLAGNDNKAASNLIREFDGTAPSVISINRIDANPLITGTTSADFRIVFSEEVTGVDISDLEIVLTANATGLLNNITAIDAKTYDVSINGVGGQGTIGLNLKDDDTIIDAATNPLLAAFIGQVYTTNFIPTDIGLSVANIDENNALNAIVGAMSTTDADASDSHTYSLVSGAGDTDNTSFAVSGLNLTTNNRSFNFESKNSYSIRLKTDDSKGGTLEKTFTITVNDVNEAPFTLSLSNNTIDESDEAQDIGSLIPLDQDNGETFTYSLVSGSGDTNNSEFEISGSTLSTAGATNFEKGPTRSVLVRVTDSGGLTLDQQFTINIGEVVIEPIRNYATNVPGAAVRNVFSPNGDGVNETWVIEDLLDNPVNEVKVFSQGGKLIYSKVNYRNDWGGTFKDNPVPDGTYYYEINIYNGEKIIKGFLTIIRNR
jgi:gliding motility-associated-like protein